MIKLNIQLVGSGTLCLELWDALFILYTGNKLSIITM